MQTLATVENGKCRRHLFGPWTRDAEHPYWHSHCTKKTCTYTCIPDPTHPICGECKRPLGQDVTPLGESVELLCMNPSCRSQGQPRKHIGFRSEHDTPEKYGRAPTNHGVFGNNLGGYGPRKSRQKILTYIRKQLPFPYNNMQTEGTQPMFLGRASQRKKLTVAFRSLERYVGESEEPDQNMKRMKQILSEHLQQFNFEDHKDELLDKIAAHVGKHLRPVEERLPRREIVDYLDAAFLMLGIPLIHQEEGVKQ